MTYNSNSIYKVVNVDKLEEATANGWHLVQCLTKKSQQAYEASKDIWHEEKNGMLHHGRETTWTMGALGEEPLFLVAKDRGDYDRVAQLETLLSDATSRIKANAEALKKAEEKVNEEQNTVARERDTVAARDARINILLADKESTEDRLRETERLLQERDEVIAALEKHFGTREIKAALTVHKLENKS